MINTEKKIAEIKARLDVDFYVFSERDMNGEIIEYDEAQKDISFLLSELDRAEKELELFDQRGETIERQLNIIEQLQEENRKLRERLKEEIVWQDECLKLEEQLQSAKQEIERLKQERDKLIEGLRWYAQRNDLNTVSLMLSDKGQRARDILKEIGVTVER